MDGRADQVIVRLDTQNVFTMKTESVFYRLEKSEGRWLVADWAGPDQQWWPQEPIAAASANR